MEGKLNEKNFKLYGLIFIILAVFPVLTESNYVMHVSILILYYTLVSQAWNILSGYTGQFSFGHAVFLGIGAYTSTILFINYNITPWVGMIIGTLVAILVGLFIGFLSFRYRLRGAYFTLGTLAFAEIMRIVVQNTKFFNKSQGFLIPLDPDPTKFQFESRTGYYYIIFTMVVILTFFVYKMSRSRLGFNLIAIRENESAAQSLGVNTFKNKMIAIALSAGITSIGGTFYAQYILYIEPGNTLGTDVSINILVPAIIGGMGTILGPFIGSLLIIPLGELTTQFFGGYAGVNLMTYGLILVIVILFLPGGIVGWFQDRFGKKE